MQCSYAPYPGIQSLLLGLWVAGNELIVYTDELNTNNRLAGFFNCYPLLS